ncbi:rhodanese-like domain-containing protein [Alisedimentitalea sp. MJ-SS2]|uniref:rhodanese-like domain-containing protein n=1 Tax=Aliisedimentitalea sp. MJ-SS2 TaxID=3049795 RepID=UPI00290F1D86|nr:rhodanese-like domain-containing protein [Alisedimentitalea sp. MJ-SS2]MDU8929598.1 rhodanese-like domain-containing protein [Alisedimentitalea sp. MJ-SS2]
MEFDRRQVLAMSVAFPAQAFATTALAQSREVWSAMQAHEALLEDRLRLLDIRSREEWQETGVTRDVGLVSMHESRFPERLFATRRLAEGRAVALICATGGRSGAVMQALWQAGHAGFVDVSEVMLGNRLGPGWIATGLPVITMSEAPVLLPAALL